MTSQTRRSPVAATRAAALSRLSIILAALWLGPAAGAQVVFHEDFNDNSAGWVLGATWQIGPAVPTGSCPSGPGDPGVDADGKAGGGIAGNPIGGCTVYVSGLNYMESPVIDATGLPNLRLEFDCWLAVYWPPDSFASVDAWNGTAWVNVYTNCSDTTTTEPPTTSPAGTSTTCRSTTGRVPDRHLAAGHLHDPVGDGSVPIAFPF